MQASLPTDRLNRMREILESSLGKLRVSKRELLSTLGHLNFAMQILPQGWSFISRLLDLSKSVEGLNDIIWLDEGARSDISCFCFLSYLCNHWNGISFFFLQRNIRFIWIYSLAVACWPWGQSWSRKQIGGMSDNIAVVHIINKGRSSLSFTNKMCRHITWTAIMNNFRLQAVHMPRIDNRAADSLSRFQFQEFCRLCSQAVNTGMHCPPFRATILDWKDFITVRKLLAVTSVLV